MSRVLEKEAIGNEVERRQDFTAGRETRSQGNACGPGQIGEGILRPQAGSRRMPTSSLCLEQAATVGHL